MMATEQQTLTQFIAREKIAMTCERADSNPNMADDEWAASATHWRCTLRRGRKRMMVYFSQGSAYTGEPKARDVLDSLALDASSYENALSFEEWCDEYGYDTDSRKHERTYRAVERQARKLRYFLGADAYESLLWHTESL